MGIRCHHCWRVCPMSWPFVMMGRPCHHFWRIYRMIVPFVMMGSPCHHLGRICWVACLRVAEEVFCPCLRSSSDQLVGRGWAVARLMRIPPFEVDRQSSQLVVGRLADSPTVREHVRLAVGAAELVARLAPRKVQCLLRPLLGDTPRS